MSSSLPLLLTSASSFEPVSKVTQVFFDAHRARVFSVRSGGATGAMLRGFASTDAATFRLDADNRGRIAGIKISPDKTTLAVHREQPQAQGMVELWAVKSLGQAGSLWETGGSVQGCRTKSAALLGFSWLGDGSNEMVMVTDHGMELYNLIAEGNNRSLKFLRSHNQSISWFTLCAASQIAVCSPSSASSSLQPLLVKAGYVYKLSKLEFEDCEPVREKEVVVCKLYGEVYIGVILMGKRGSSIKRELHLYHVAASSKTAEVAKQFVLKLPEECAGSSLAVNSVDDLVLVHCQSEGKTFVFDVIFGDSDGTVTYCSPVTVAEFAEDRSATASSSSLSSAPKLYAQSWSCFQPDVIVDAKIGQMWKVKLKLDNVERLMKAISDPARLIAFLSKREGTKVTLLQVLLHCCLDKEVKIRTVGQLLDQVNDGYRSHVDAQVQTQMALSASFSARSVLRQTMSPGLSVDEPGHVGSASPAQQKSRPVVPKVVVDQADLFASLFSPMLERMNKKTADDDDDEEDSDSTTQSISCQRLISILMEYFRSLEQHRLSVQHFLSELLINLLVTSRQWYQLHILLQYRIIPDSKPMACLLLSLESAYPPALQLAMDMLHRLKNSVEEICEVLLSKQLVIPALKVAVSCRDQYHLPVRKYLEAALEHQDETVFLNVYQHLQAWQARGFVVGDSHKEYLQKHRERRANGPAREEE